jgi:hypothetical protein
VIWQPHYVDIQIGKEGWGLMKPVSLPELIGDLSILDVLWHISTGRVCKLEWSDTTAASLCPACGISDQPSPCTESQAGSRAELI